MTLSVSPTQPYDMDPQAIEGGNAVTDCSPSTSSSAISEALALADLKREAVQKSLEKVHSLFSSIGPLTLQWKNVDDHFASVKQSIAQQWKESETNLKRTEWRTKRLNNKEKDLAEKCKDLAEKCKDVDATYALVSRCYSTLEEKKAELSWNLQEAESVRQRLELMLKQTLAKERALEEITRADGVSLSEREELRLKKQSLDVREVNLTEREKRLNFMERVMSDKSSYFESQHKKFIKLQKREVEFQRRSASVKLREDKVESRERAVTGKIQNLKIEQKKLEQAYKALKEKERCVDSMLDQVKGDSVDPPDADIRFYITMNGRELQRYLSNRVTEFDFKCLHDEVKRALLLSANPGKLVLDALHGFYPSVDSDISDQGVSLEVLRRTCIFILECFKEMGLKNIPEKEKERALLLAGDWKRKMRIINCHSKSCLENVGFLRLVDSYRLLGKLGDGELLKFVEMVRQNSSLGSGCKNLGISDKIQDTDITPENAAVDLDNRSAVEKIGHDLFSNDHPKGNIVLGLKAEKACSSIRPCHSGIKRIIKKNVLQKRKRGLREAIFGSSPKNQSVRVQKPAEKKKKFSY